MLIGRGDDREDRRVDVADPAPGDVRGDADIEDELLVNGVGERVVQRLADLDPGDVGGDDAIEDELLVKVADLDPGDVGGDAVIDELLVSGVGE